MGFVIKYDFILDMLCLMDVLTGDAFYVEQHEAIYEQFAPQLSHEAQEALSELQQLLGSTRISPQIAYMLSISEDFNRHTIRECFEKPGRIAERLDGIEDVDLIKSVGEYVSVVAEELVQKGLYDYWIENSMPKLEEKVVQLEAHRSGLSPNRDGQEKAPLEKEEYTIWLSSYVISHSMKLYGQNYIANMRMSNEEIFIKKGYLAQ